MSGMVLISVPTWSMDGGIHTLTEVPPMNPRLLPAAAPDDVPAWQQTVVAFLAEKEGRSGSQRTVESYARMLWPFLTRIGSPDLVTPAHILAWAHGVGASGREPS